LISRLCGFALRILCVRKPEREAVCAAADEFSEQAERAATNTYGKSKWYLTRSKTESRATEETQSAA